MRRLKFLLLQLLLFMSLFIFCGCRSTAELEEEQLPFQGPVTLSVLENHLAGPDPCEGFNRSMFAVTSFLMDYLADPLGRIYASILPRPVIEHFNNLCVNLEFPARAVSCLIRAEWLGAGRETARFFINLTVGIAGLFDPAEHWWQIHSTDSDFGQAFAAWGIAPGCSFILPASAALNVRDQIGSFFDMAFDLKTYIPYSGWATALNRMVIAHRAYQQVVEGSNDRYKNYRELALLGRELKLRMWRYRNLYLLDQLREEGKLPAPLADTPKTVKPAWLKGKWMELAEYGPGDPIQDSLRTVLFRPQKNDDFWYLRLSVFNDDFSKKAHTLKLRIAPDRPKLACAFWEMPHPGKDAEGNDLPPLKERLAVLLPGIGGTAASGASVALAELLHQNGFAVLVIDSTFSWQFVNSRAGCRLPGFLPADASALRNIIKFALDELKKDQLIRNPELVLTGYSFGGMHTLKIAELEEKEPLLGIRQYLAISPPASLDHAILQADRLGNAFNGKTRKEIVDLAVDAAGMLAASAVQTLPPYDENADHKQRYRLSVEPRTAEFISGLYLRSSMRGMLFCAHRERGLIPLDMPVKFSRNELYLELDKITFREYAQKYLLAEYPGVELKTLYRKSDLRSLQKTLKNNQNVHVLHAYNDFLLSDSDRRFLDSALGSRIIWTDRGGHLGHFYYKCVQEQIVKQLKGTAKDIVSKKQNGNIRMEKKK